LNFISEGINPMAQPDTTHYRHKLLAVRTALLEQIAGQRGGRRSRADVAAEHFQHTEDSTAQVASERDLEFAIGEHETAELQALDAALARLDAGHYGLCTDCGVAIPKARLDAAPEAPRCLSCQTQAERSPT
jgi:DnaK suppressor protein